MFDFSSKVVLVTGASRGIGRQVAEDMAQEGAFVVLASRSAGGAEKAAEEISQKGGRAQGFALDVGDPKQVKSSVSRVLQEQGRIDVLINNAGITRDGLLARMKDEDWEDVLATNLTGAFRMAREVTKPMMRQRCGRIINIASVVALSGNPGQCNYTASKAGLIGFTKSLARELAPRSVTVNAVAPGFIETDMTAELGDKAAQSIQSQIPLKRIGSASDVSFGVRFLASDEAGYVTGHVLNISGGLHM